MKVSFVIPIWKKTPDQLRRCLSSLFDQSHKDVEVICSFDGEDKRLMEVVEEFKDAKVIVNEHKGASAARNAGAKLATGDIISFWDADCYAEPEMARVWVMFFEEDKECDFVYGGYKWTDQTVPGYDSEPAFDEWLLKKYNFLCSMNPVRREKSVEWDESLTGLQDWDYWRRIVANGAKGVYNKGYGFSTDFPDRDSISGQGVEVKNNRISAIRRKFEDKHPDILVLGQAHKREAIKIAKLLDADYFSNTAYWVVRDYKLVLSIGFHAQEMESVSEVFKNAKSGTVRAIYWTGQDVESLQFGPFVDVKKIIASVNESIHVNFCPDQRAKDILEGLGIKAEILASPRYEGSLAESLPKLFRVLAFYDDKYAPFIKPVIRAMPDINIDDIKQDTSLRDYSAVIHFSSDPRLTDGPKNALIQGRYLISNIQQPYTGYVEIGEDLTVFKNEIINRVRELKNEKSLNLKAREYYLAESDPTKFKEEILKLIPVPVEAN